MIYTGILLFIMSISCMHAAQRNDILDLRMAEDGKSRVTVVIPENSGDHVAFAAHDMIRCLNEALGVQVPSVETLAQVKTPLSILIGSDFGVSFGVSTSDLHRDACVIKTHGGSMLITGPSEFGIVNGIYTFLMEYAGIRWFGPGESYEIIPANPDLRLPVVDITSKPDFSFRIMSGLVGQAGSEWQKRNRLDYNRDDLPYIGFGHNLKNIFPPSLYGKDHPEYYAMIDGKRCVPENDKTEDIQPCFTNPDAVRIAAEAADRFFKANPKATTFALGINDSIRFCRCPSCSALDEPRRKSKSGSDIYSESYFSFVEQVAKIVEKTNPGKHLGCYAYWGVELPPRNIDKLPDNVVIALTQDTSQHFDPEYRKSDRDLWAAWNKMAKNVSKYDYYGLGWLTPRFFPRLAADDLKFLKENKTVGAYVEAHPNWCITGPQIYIAVRLLWDSSLDAESLMDDYCKALFGAAAPEMKKFYGILESYWTRPRQGQWFQGLFDMDAELAIADEKLIEEAWQCLFRAKPLALGRESERVVDAEDHFKLTYHLVTGYALSTRLAGWQVKNRDDLARAISEALKALEKVRLAGVAYEDKWANDPRYAHAYYKGERFDKKFATWKNRIRDGVQAAVNTVYDYCQVKLPEGEREVVWSDLCDRLLQDPTAKELGINGAVRAD